MPFCYAIIFTLLGFGTFPAVSMVFPIVTSHGLGTTLATALFTDLSRLDPFAKDDRARSIMISAFYPVGNCRKNETFPYMPPYTATFQDEKFSAYGLPNDSFPSLALQNCKDGPSRQPNSGSLPLVLFSGALGTSRLLYSIVSVDHPYDADIVEYPNGTVITRIDIEDSAIDLALTTRVEDMAFIYQQMKNVSTIKKLFPGYKGRFNNQKTAIIGHSLGGATAAATMLKIPSIRGGVNLDGSMFGSILEVGLNHPFMLLGHENKTQETDPSWKAVWPKFTGWRKEFEVKGAAHYSFSDLPLAASVLGLADKLPTEIGQVIGTLEGHRMMDITAGYVTVFLDIILKNGDRQNLVGGDCGGKFPEVVDVA